MHFRHGKHIQRNFPTNSRYAISIARLLWFNERCLHIAARYGVRLIVLLWHFISIGSTYNGFFVSSMYYNYTNLLNEQLYVAMNI